MPIKSDFAVAATGSAIATPDINTTGAGAAIAAIKHGRLPTSPARIAEDVAGRAEDRLILAIVSAAVAAGTAGSAKDEKATAKVPAVLAENVAGGAKNEITKAKFIAFAAGDTSGAIYF